MEKQFRNIKRFIFSSFYEKTYAATRRTSFQVKGVFLVLLVLFACDDFFEKDISDKLISYMTPATGWSSENAEVNFSWSHLEDASSYHFQLVSPSFEAAHELVVDSTTSSNNLQLNLPPSDYAWRIRGENSVSATMYSSGEFEILPQYDISTQEITISKPENNQLIKTSTIAFNWAAIEGVSYYDIQIKKGSWTEEVFYEDKAYSNSFDIVLEDGSYIFGVAAVDTASDKRTDFALVNFTVDLLSPDSPMPILPSNGDTVRTNNVQFCWSSSEEVNLFEIEIYSDADLSQLTEKKESNDTTVFITVENNGQYYWRLKATDNFQNESAYSPVSTFILDSELAVDLSDEVVVLRSPNTTGYIVTTTVSFWWEELEGATGYELQVVSPDFLQTANLLVNDKLTETSAEYELSEGDYEWRVRAYNDGYSTGFTKGTFSIYQNDLSTELVNIVSPMDGFITNKTLVGFEWEELEGVEYQFVLKKDDWEAGTVLHQKKLQGTKLELNLSEGTHYWGVKAIDTINFSETEYSVRSITIDNTPPKIPVAISPSANSDHQVGTLQFEWTLNDDQELNPVYYIEVYKENTGANTLLYDQEVNGTELSYHFSDVGTYYWHVRAEDEAGNLSNFSSLSPFNILNDNDLNDKKVSLNSPYSGFSTSNTEITFWWEELNNAESYKFQLVSPNFTNIEELINESELSSNKITLTLSPGTYQWRVKAVNSTSETNYSTANSLTVNE